MPTLARFVRVRDQRTGHEYSVTAAKAKRDDQLHPISGDAVDDKGRPLPATLATPAPAGYATPKPSAPAQK